MGRFGSLAHGIGRPAYSEAMSNPGVLVVEDDAFTRGTLVAALQRYGLVVTSAVASAREALMVDPLPDVALLDLNLGPGPSGIDLAHELRHRHETIGLVLLTSYEDPRLLASDLPPAPRGTRHLSKRQVGEVSEVISAIKSAQQSPLEAGTHTRVAVSDALLDVLRGVAEGLSTPEIAKRRGVSEKAVEAAITKLCEHFDLQRLPSHNQRVRLASEYYAMTGQAPR